MFHVEHSGNRPLRETAGRLPRALQVHIVARQGAIMDTQQNRIARLKPCSRDNRETLAPCGNNG